MKLISSGSFYGIVLAISAFLISLIISLFSYRYLWENADKSFLVAWLIVFEASQLLLLLDLGFTHAFIRNFKSASHFSAIAEELPSLRTVLAISGTVALVISLIISYVVADRQNFLPFIFLASSILITIVSYADTAALRVLERHHVVYGANIFGGIIYLGVLFGFSVDVEFAIALASLARAACQLLVQNLMLGAGMYYGKPMCSGFGTKVIFLNVSYFSLFMLDGFFFTLMGFQGSALAIILLNKKMYDVLRGLWDSIVQVLSIDYTKRHNRNRDLLVSAFIVLSFATAFLLSEKALLLWLGDFSYDANLSISLCLSTMSLALYRNQTMKAYFQDQKGIYFFSILAVAIKIIFFVVLYLGGQSFINSAYLGQALFIVFAIFVLKRLRFK
ncbi:hypothetical protein [Terasakiella sp.]|uniref:hypothetical protein n=1 Tax=Terasakiella sp. TaxID=2034861 RepID=UPI003AA84260